MRQQALWQKVPIVVTGPGPDQQPAVQGERRPVAMTPCAIAIAIAVALFAAFVVGGMAALAGDRAADQAPVLGQDLHIALP